MRLPQLHSTSFSIGYAPPRGTFLPHAFTSKNRLKPSFSDSFYSLARYRYRFNGYEADNEVKGDGNSYTTQFRQYDPRLGRWLSLDPEMKLFAFKSPYKSFSNNPITYIDPNGDTDYYNLKGKKVGSDGLENGLIGIVHNSKIARQIKKGKFKLVENPKNGDRFSGGFIIHKDILVKSIELLKEAKVHGQDRELSTTMDRSEDGKSFEASPIIIGEPNNNGNETISISNGEVSIHSHPLGFKKIGRNIYRGSSTRPSDDVDGPINDKSMFPQHKMNIIVGNSKEPTIVDGSPKIDQGELEIRVFGENHKDVIGSVSLKNAEKIVKSLSKKM